MIYDAERRDISIAVGGDAMITRRMRPHKEEAFLKLAKILRDADVTVVNLEMLFHDYESSWQWSGATYTRSDPHNLEDLKWLGIDAVTTANNHSFDFSEGGFLTTLEHCREIDLPTAGGGRNIDEARAPAYVDSPRGRLAIMSTTSTFSEQSRAGPGRPDFPGRPGVNALRHQLVHHVERDVFEALNKAKKELGYQETQEATEAFGFRGASEAIDHATEVEFLENKFILSEEFAVKTSPNPDDVAGIGNWLRGAQKQSDWMIYGAHCHESGATGEFHGSTRVSPPDFLVEFAHWTIDQGCALFAGHGPHFLRGIEIYKNRPIFYSLGNFIFQNESVLWLPQEAYRRFNLGYDQTPGDYLDTRSGGGTRAFAGDPVFWQSVVAVCNYAGGELREIVLHPIDMGYGRPIPQRGRPVLAEGHIAQQTLTWLQDVSRPYGTEISIEGDTGFIRL
ncbi:MAG: CapA family protein [Chloroflexi bacterium]|nr:CapA family protein [Chloroflexota bacterium]